MLLVLIHRVERSEASVLIAEAQADTKMALGQFPEAEPIAKEVFWGYYSLYGAEATHTLKARERMDALYKAWGEPQKEAAWRDELSEIEDPRQDGYMRMLDNFRALLADKPNTMPSFRDALAIQGLVEAILEQG